MPDGDKNTPQGVPAPGPAPAGGSTSAAPAPAGLGAGGGGQQAPEPASGPAPAPQQGPAQGTAPQPTKGAPWTQTQREEKFQTLYQQAKPKLDAYAALGTPEEIAAKLKAASEPAKPAPQAQPTDAPTGDPNLTTLWNQCARSAYDNYLTEVETQYGRTMALQEAQRLGVLKTQVAQAPVQQQPVPNLAELEAKMEQIAHQTYRRADTQGYDFQKRLDNFAKPYGGDQFLQAEITVETPNGQIKMTREEAAHRFNDWANDQGRPVQDMREIFREVDPAGLRELEKQQLLQEVWKDIQAKQASGQVYVGPTGAPPAQQVQPGMATPTAALSDGLTQVAAASDRHGLNVLTKPTFPQGK